MTAQPVLSVIIVNWNTRDLLARCLESVLAPQRAGGPGRRLEASGGTAEAPPCQGEAGCGDGGAHPPVSGRQSWLEVLVVDNGSSDGSVEMVRDRFPQVRLIANGENLGFTRANNQALAIARGRYLMLLNSDTEVLPGALEAMVAAMDSHPEVGVLGPQLLNSDGTIQSSRRRFPTLATAFVESTVLQRFFPHHPLLRRYYVLDRPDSISQEVDWVVGACLVARREVLEQVGGLDESFFMYSEELDWCRRIRAAGWKVLYLPEAKVVHHEGKSSERDPRHRHEYFQESKCRYFHKHHGPAAAAILRLFISASYGFQLIEEALKLALGHKPDLRRHRIGVYWAVIRHLLAGSARPGPASGGARAHGPHPGETGRWT